MLNTFTCIMRIKIYLLLTVIFFCFTGMKCEKSKKVINDLSCIKVENLRIEGKNLISAKGSIKQELYTLGIKFLDKKMQEQDYIIYFQRHIVNLKIYSNSIVDAKYPIGSDITNFFISYPSDYYNGSKYKLSKKINAGIHSFKVKFYREDGSVIEAETESIELL